MKNPLLLSIVAGGVAGIAASAATGLFFRPVSTSAEPLATRDVAPASEGEWKRELELVRAENAMLAQRLQSLESEPAREVERQPVEPTPDPAVARLEEQLRQLLAAMTIADAPLPAALESSVRDVYTSIQEEERLEREARVVAIRDAEMNARMERYATELGLDGYQTDEMRAILVRERDERDRLLADARSSGNLMDLRDQMRDLRSTTLGSLSTLLTEDQLAKYQEFDRRFGLPGGFAPPRATTGGETPGGGGS